MQYPQINATQMYFAKYWSVSRLGRSADVNKGKDTTALPQVHNVEAKFIAKHKNQLRPAPIFTLCAIIPHARPSLSGRSVEKDPLSL